jgi:hypothetical protein
MQNTNAYVGTEERERTPNEGIRAGNWGEPKEDRGLLITLYSLVVLKDLGLDQQRVPNHGTVTSPLGGTMP